MDFLLLQYPIIIIIIIITLSSWISPTTTTIVEAFTITTRCITITKCKQKHNLVNRNDGNYHLLLLPAAQSSSSLSGISPIPKQKQQQQQQVKQSWMVKTKESFKVTDLVFLEAQIILASQHHHHSWNCTRILIDKSTGSSLIRFDFFCEDDNDNVSSDNNALQSLLLSTCFVQQRCDWIGEILVHQQQQQQQDGETSLLLDDPLVEQFLIQLRNNNTTTITNNILETCHDWTLDYLRMEEEQQQKLTSNNNNKKKQQKQKQKQKQTFTMKTLLCSIAQLMPLPPVLDPQKAHHSLLVVQAVVAPTIITTTTTTTTSSGGGMFLIKLLTDNFTTKNKNHHVLLFENKKWAQRPFQYSSAINPTIAQIVIDILYDMVVQQQSSKDIDNHDNTTDNIIRLWDPTCGSGTFLALALTKGMTHVEGWDINSHCVQGTQKNLEYLFGASDNNNILNQTRLVVRDSSSSYDDDNNNNTIISNINCIVTNLPWGLNSLDVKQNLNILSTMYQRVVAANRHVKSRKSSNIPCAIIYKDPQFLDTIQECGYFDSIVGTAHVPPQDFHLPVSNKQKQTSKSSSAQQQQQKQDKGRSHCIITIANIKTL